jgi:glutamine amidotransferase
MGNVKSVCNAIKRLGAEPVIADTPSMVNGEKIIIPGVGAFGDGMRNLRPYIPKIMEVSASDVPLLGICIGMQMFFEGSEENPAVEGLGLIKGRVVRIETELRLPHIGWNYLDIKKRDCPLFQGVEEGFLYFLHSYHVHPEDDVIAATTSYGCTVNASVWKKNVLGTQFHPEKSGELGLKILNNFLEL